MATYTAARPLGALGRMSLVAAIHAVALLAIMRSLGIGVAPADPPPDITIDIRKETRPPEEIPPPPEVPIVKSEILLPDVPIEDLRFEPQDVITGPVAPEYVEQPPTGSAEPRPQIVGVRQDPRNPLSKPQYSARMIREGNQGTIEIEVYVQPNGRVGDARVVRSTGFEELDRAALAEAKRNWRLLPATRDGVAIAQWHRLRVTYRLDER
jgi:periplasmic protein TonB